MYDMYSTVRVLVMWDLFTDCCDILLRRAGQRQCVAILLGVRSVTKQNFLPKTFYCPVLGIRRVAAPLAQ